MHSEEVFVLNRLSRSKSPRPKVFTKLLNQNSDSDSGPKKLNKRVDRLLENTITLGPDGTPPETMMLHGIIHKANFESPTETHESEARIRTSASLGHTTPKFATRRETSELSDPRQHKATGRPTELQPQLYNPTRPAHRYPSYCPDHDSQFCNDPVPSRSLSKDLKIPAPYAVALETTNPHPSRLSGRPLPALPAACESRRQPYDRHSTTDPEHRSRSNQTPGSNKINPSNNKFDNNTHKHNNEQSIHQAEDDELPAFTEGTADHEAQAVVCLDVSAEEKCRVLLGIVGRKNLLLARARSEHQRLVELVKAQKAELCVLQQRIRGMEVDRPNHGSRSPGTHAEIENYRRPFAELDDSTVAKRENIRKGERFFTEGNRANRPSWLTNESSSLSFTSMKPSLNRGFKDSQDNSLPPVTPQVMSTGFQLASPIHRREMGRSFQSRTDDLPSSPQAPQIERQKASLGQSSVSFKHLQPLQPLLDYLSKKLMFNSPDYEGLLAHVRFEFDRLQEQDRFFSELRRASLQLLQMGVGIEALQSKNNDCPRRHQQECDSSNPDDVAVPHSTKKLWRWLKAVFGTVCAQKTELAKVAWALTGFENTNTSNSDLEGKLSESLSENLLEIISSLKMDREVGSLLAEKISTLFGLKNQHDDKTTWNRCQILELVCQLENAVTQFKNNNSK